MKTIAEKNRMIAEFMGFKLQADPNERFFNQWFTKPTNAWVGRIEILHFDSSWDWLMPVVEEIDHLEYESERLDNINEAIKTRQIGSVHQAVVEFIEWHNENK